MYWYKWLNIQSHLCVKVFEWRVTVIALNRYHQWNLNSRDKQTNKLGDVPIIHLADPLFLVKIRQKSFPVFYSQPLKRVLVVLCLWALQAWGSFVEFWFLMGGGVYFRTDLSKYLFGQLLSWNSRSAKTVTHAIPEYQTDVVRCTFDTLGKLTSALWVLGRGQFPHRYKPWSVLPPAHGWNKCTGD